MGKRVLITGATGMIGGLVLQQCLNSNEVESVISLLRRPSGVEHEKLKEIILNDFLHLDENAPYFEGVNIVYYCQGFYTGAVDRETFRKITVDYPEALAKVLIEKSPNLLFCLLSGAGADRKEKSRMMFAKDKGTIENILSKTGFKAFHAFRPGYIYPVTPCEEPSFSYRLSRWLYPIIKLFGTNTSIKSTELAQAMFNVGLNGCDLEILENSDILGQLFWAWLAIPMIIFGLDACYRFFIKHKHVVVAELRSLSERVTQITFEQGTKFAFSSGDYVKVKIPAISQSEWHPFTLSAAPESSSLDVHVRSNGDWSGALHNLANQQQSQPQPLRAYVDGPYGAPTSCIYRSRVAILIAGGIGVTPLRVCFTEHSATP